MCVCVCVVRTCVCANIYTGLLPADPDWSSYPEAIVRDPLSKEAIIAKMLKVEAQDPNNNADYGIIEYPGATNASDTPLTRLLHVLDNADYGIFEYPGN